MGGGREDGHANSRQLLCGTRGGDSGCPGKKLYETRGWATNYRGPLAIYTAGRWSKIQSVVLGQEPFRSVLGKHGFMERNDLPLGCVVAVVDLTAVYRTEDMRASLAEQELAFGDYGNLPLRLEVRKCAAVG